MNRDNFCSLTVAEGGWKGIEKRDNRAQAPRMATSCNKDFSTGTTKSGSGLDGDGDRWVDTIYRHANISISSPSPVQYM